MGYKNQKRMCDRCKEEMRYYVLVTCKRNDVDDGRFTEILGNVVICDKCWKFWKAVGTVEIICGIHY